MLLTPWWKLLAYRFGYRFSRRPRRARPQPGNAQITPRRAPPLSFERLEDRTLLSLLTVNTTADENRRDDFLSLREAVLIVNGTLDEGSLTPEERHQLNHVDPLGTNDTIVFQSGLGQISLTQGQIAVSESVTMIGHKGLRIDGQLSTRIFNITDTDVALTLRKMDLRNGRDLDGAAIRSVSNELLTIDESFIRDNHSSGGRGGAIHLSGSGDLLIRRSQITDNRSPLDGGAIYAYNGTVTVVESRFSNNNAGGRGGAIHNLDGDIVVKRSSFDGNVTAGNFANGGAIAAGNGDVTISESLFMNNRTIGGLAHGGALAIDYGNLTIINSTLSGNSTSDATANGGAIYSIIGDVRLVNSTVTLNTARGSAGGIYFFNPAASTGMLTIHNSIVAQNTSNSTTIHDIAAPAGPGSVVDVRYSFIGDNVGTSLIETGLAATDADGNFIGSTGTGGGGAIDPLLGPLEYHGSGEAHAPLAGSPVLNAGSAALAVDPANGNAPLTSDQRGFPFARDFGGVDMGAYELQSLTLVVDTLSEDNDWVVAPGDFSLREAIEYANANPGHDHITFAPGLNGTPLLLERGQFNINDSLTITGNGAANTIIDAQQLSRIFNIAASAGDVTLDGLTLANGRTTGNNYSHLSNYRSGGAIRSLATGTLTIANSTVSNNATTGTYANGGAVFSVEGNVAVMNSTVSDNSTLGQDASGGAIASTYGAVSVESSTISRNSTSGAFAPGGAVYVITGGVSISGSTIDGNSTLAFAASGGAIFSVNGPVNISHSSVVGNSTAGEHASGGAIDTVGGVVTVTSSILSGNSATGRFAYGGAIHARDNGGVSVINSTLSGNSTTGDYATGGAIRSRSAYVTVTNSTLSGNSTAGGAAHGGAIYAGSYGGNLYVTITNSTIVQNESLNGNGGGIYTLRNGIDLVTITNSIVARNTDNGNAPDVRIVGVGTLTVSHSLIGDNSGTTLVATVGATPDANGNFIGSGANPVDPLLGPLQDNGGPTFTHALLVGSLAINSGDNDLAVDPTNGDAALTSDQRGTPFTRTFGAAVDMGAFEAQTFTFLVDNATDEDDGDYSAGDLSLREAVALANLNPGHDEITFHTDLNGTPLLLDLGQIEITDSLTITGNGRDNTIIDAQQLSRIFDLSEAGLHVTLSGLTLQNGQTSGSDENGGAIRSSGFVANALTILDSTLSHNAAMAGASGGAIFMRRGDVIVSNSLLIANETSGHGGAVALDFGLLRIEASTLSGNRAAGSGGAVHSGNDGYLPGRMEIIDSLLSSNVANGNAGAIFGGAQPVVVVNSTLSDNRTESDISRGGAIYIPYNPYGSTGSVTAINSTIVQNQNTAIGASAGGIAAGHVTLRNTILAQNSSTYSPDLLHLGGSLSVQHSLIGDNSGTTLVATVGDTPDANGNFIGSGANPIDPLLGFLVDNGGATFTHALQPGSLAVNSGDNDLAVDPTNGDAALTTDQRGGPFVRVFGSAVDMGAFEAQTFTFLVDTATDEDDGDYSAGNLSLREAIALANLNPGHDEITFHTDLNGVPLLLSLGQIEITDSLTITGNGRDNTIIDAQQLSRIFDITATADDVTLSGLTLQNGETIANGVAFSGGAVRSFASGGLTIENSALTGNRTRGDHARGGAVFSEYGLSITGSTLTGNLTHGYRGEGGAIAARNGLFINDSTFSGNSATGDTGRGGAAAALSGDVWVSGSTFTANSTVYDFASGGAIAAIDGNVRVSGSTFSNNNTTAMHANGGAIYARGAVTVVDSTLSGNTVTFMNYGSHGGAIYAQGLVTLRNSTISGNVASGENSRGGGIFTLWGANIVNSTLSGNSAWGPGGSGGGIYMASTDGVGESRSLVIVNSTIFDNSAGWRGGGLFVSDIDIATTVSIHNSIVAGNTAGQNPDLRGSGTLDVHHSLIGDNTGTSLVATDGNTPDANGSFIGSGALPIDPLLGPLAFNGGPRQTHAILEGSLALNSGSNALAVDPTNGDAALVGDERGETFDRIVGEAVDMGAFETQTLPFPQVLNFGYAGGADSWSPDGRYLAFHVSEFRHGNADLNGDGDVHDSVLHLWDTATGSVTNLMLSASYLRWSPDGSRLAVRVMESAQGNTDFNGDGDSNDHVLHIWEASTGDVTNLSLEALAGMDWSPDGQQLALRIYEDRQGDTDLNGDGDANDSVVHVWDVATGITTNLMLGVSSFISWSPTSDYMAIGVSESDQGHTDLNGDGDSSDTVVHIWNRQTGDTTNQMRDIFTGAHWSSDGEYLAWRVREAQQGNIDLNGDGDAGDMVLHIWEADTGDVTNVMLDSRGFTWQPGGTQLALTVSETAQGNTDLNGDGDAADAVVHIYDAATGDVTNLMLYSSQSNFGWSADGEYLAINVWEDRQGNTDLNGDGDATDNVMHVWESSTGIMTNLMINAAGGFLWSPIGSDLALSVVESQEGASDFNLDGDQGDEIVHVWRAQSAAITNLHLDIGFSGWTWSPDARRLAIDVEEAEQGSTDLNGDGDADDTVLHVWDSVTGEITNLMLHIWSTARWSPNGEQVVLSVSELHQGNQDLNGDGEVDLLDNVMHIVDFAPNAPPIATDDNLSTSENTPLAGNLLTADNGHGPDHDPDGDDLAITAINGDDALVGTQITLASGALLTVNADGSFTYNPNGQFEHLNVGDQPTETFTYTIADPEGLESEATVTITVQGVNDEPFATANTASTAKNATVSGNMLTDDSGAGVDSDVDSSLLTVTHINGIAVTSGQTVTLPGGTLLTIHANGSYTYNPNGKFDHLAFGQTAVQGFTYTVSDGDGDGGTAQAQVTITIHGNHLRIVGTTAYITGTAAADTIAFNVQTRALSVNASQYVLPAGLTFVQLDGGGGVDRLTLHGSSGNDRAVIRPGLILLDYLPSPTGFDLFGFSMEIITFHGNGGSDQAFLDDSGANDVFTSSPLTASMTGSGFSNTVHGVQSISGRAIVGGNDRALLLDSAGNDVFSTTPTTGNLSGSGYFLSTVGFEIVEGRSVHGGHDTAFLQDASGNDLFVSSGGVADMSTTSFLHRVRDFATVSVRAIHGGTDTAILRDTAGNDTFVSRPQVSFLQGSGKLVEVVGFETVSAQSTSGGFDQAFLYDGAGNDVFTATPLTAQISSGGVARAASGFDVVAAYAINGGIDSATLFDSAGMDTLSVSPGVVNFSGTEYFIQAQSFEHVTVRSIAGGTDRAFFTDGPGNDQFVGIGFDARLTSGGLVTLAQHFETVSIFGVNGGLNTLSLTSPAYLFAQSGTWTVV